MMQKYGVENVTNHFMSFNTICDATQVSVPVLFLLNWQKYLESDLGRRAAGKIT